VKLKSFWLSRKQGGIMDKGRFQAESNPWKNTES
jgi:hypothetical protein